MLIRIKVKDIRETGRAAQGVRLIDLDGGDRVVAVAKLAEPDDTEEEPPGSLPPAAAPVVEGSKPKNAQPGAPFLEDEEEE
jgi:DNA gyrase subunit A